MSNTLRDGISVVPQQKALDRLPASQRLTGLNNCFTFVEPTRRLAGKSVRLWGERICWVLQQFDGDIGPRQRDLDTAKP